MPNGPASPRPRFVASITAMAWLSAVLFAVGAAGYAPRTAATPHVGIEGPNEPVAALLSQLVIFVAFATVGAVVTRRRSDHPIGWLLLGAGWLFALSELLHGHAHRTILGAGHGGAAASWASVLSIAAFMVAFAAVTLALPLLFPDGRLLSPRWRIIAWVGGIGWGMATLGELLWPGPLSSFPEIDNPLGMSGLAGVLGVMDMATLLWGAGMLGAVGSVIVRFARSRGPARQQFKWVALPATLLIGFVGLNEFVDLAPAVRHVLFATALGGLPVGVGIAVLRYRLYDIDRLVSRTASYAVVIGTLLAVYAGVVVVLQGLIPATRDSPLTVAASTLLVAALFNPLRRRVQVIVDRRFNRRRYDAVAAAEAFARRVRAGMDLSSVVQELTDAVDDVLAPATAAVWIGPPPAEPSSGQRWRDR